MATKGIEFGKIVSIERDTELDKMKEKFIARNKEKSLQSDQSSKHFSNKADKYSDYNVKEDKFTVVEDEQKYDCNHVYKSDKNIPPIKVSPNTYEILQKNNFFNIFQESSMKGQKEIENLKRDMQDFDKINFEVNRKTNIIIEENIQVSIKNGEETTLINKVEKKEFSLVDNQNVFELGVKQDCMVRSISQNSKNIGINYNNYNVTKKANNVYIGFYDIPDEFEGDCQKGSVHDSRSFEYSDSFENLSLCSLKNNPSENKVRYEKSNNEFLEVINKKMVDIEQNSKEKEDIIVNKNLAYAGIEINKSYDFFKKIENDSKKQNLTQRSHGAKRQGSNGIDVPSQVQSISDSKIVSETSRNILPCIEQIDTYKEDNRKSSYKKKGVTDKDSPKDAEETLKAILNNTSERKSKKKTKFPKEKSLSKERKTPDDSYEKQKSIPEKNTAFINKNLKKSNTQVKTISNVSEKSKQRSDSKDLYKKQNILIEKKSVFSRERLKKSNTCIEEDEDKKSSSKALRSNKKSAGFRLQDYSRNKHSHESYENITLKNSISSKNYKNRDRKEFMYFFQEYLKAKIPKVILKKKSILKTYNMILNKKFELVKEYKNPKYNNVNREKKNVRFSNKKEVITYRIHKQKIYDNNVEKQLNDMNISLRKC